MDGLVICSADFLTLDNASVSTSCGLYFEDRGYGRELVVFVEVVFVVTEISSEEIDWRVDAILVKVGVVGADD